MRLHSAVAAAISRMQFVYERGNSRKLNLIFAVCKHYSRSTPITSPPIEVTAERMSEKTTP